MSVMRAKLKALSVEVVKGIHPINFKKPLGLYEGALQLILDGYGITVDEKDLPFFFEEILNESSELLVNKTPDKESIKIVIDFMYWLKCWQMDKKFYFERTYVWSSEVAAICKILSYNMWWILAAIHTLYLGLIVIRAIMR